MTAFDGHGGSGPNTGAWGASTAAAAVALILYLLTAQEAPYSDSVHLARVVERSPQPYYNFCYRPFAWTFQRVGEVFFGWSFEVALRTFSAVCAALGVLLLGRLLRNAGAPASRCFAWCLLVAATPGVWFFATLVEVQALQFLGIVISIDVALRARRSPPGRAALLVLLAAVIAVSMHSSSVLALPSLALLATRPRRSSDAAGLAWPALAKLVGFTALIFTLALVLAPPRKAVPESHPLGMLWVGLAIVADWFTVRGLFSPAEVVAFVFEEWVLPSGLALLALFAASLGRRNELLAPALVALVTYVGVFSQSGVRENGAYFISLLPFFVLAGERGLQSWSPAKRPAARLASFALGLCVVLQFAWGWLFLSAQSAGRDPAPHDWAGVVIDHCPAGSLVITTSLPRWHALAHSGVRYEARDLQRDFELLPRRRWNGQVLMRLGEIAQFIDAGKRVFLGADFVRNTGEFEPIDQMLVKMEEHEARLVPVGDAGDPQLYEVELDLP